MHVYRIEDSNKHHSEENPADRSCIPHRLSQDQKNLATTVLFLSLVLVLCPADCYPGGTFNSNLKNHSLNSGLIRKIVGIVCSGCGRFASQHSIQQITKSGTLTKKNYEISYANNY